MGMFGTMVGSFELRSSFSSWYLGEKITMLVVMLPCLLLAVVLVVVFKLVFGRKNNKRNLLGSKERELLDQRAGITYSVCKLSTTINFFLF